MQDESDPGRHRHDREGERVAQPTMKDGVPPAETTVELERYRAGPKGRYLEVGPRSP